MCLTTPTGGRHHEVVNQQTFPGKGALTRGAGQAGSRAATYRTFTIPGAHLPLLSLVFPDAVESSFHEVKASSRKRRRASCLTSYVLVGQ
jgi:hypothetical protein